MENVTFYVFRVLSHISPNTGLLWCWYSSADMAHAMRDESHNSHDRFTTSMLSSAPQDRRSFHRYIEICFSVSATRYDWSLTGTGQRSITGSGDEVIFCCSWPVPAFHTWTCVAQNQHTTINSFIERLHRSVSCVDIKETGVNVGGMGVAYSPQCHQRTAILLLQLWLGHTNHSCKNCRPTASKSWPNLTYWPSSHCTYPCNP